MHSLSIIIATYNRSQLLKETLENLMAQFSVTLESKSSQVIIVDNNSSDDTRAVAEEFTGKYGCIHYVIETRQGLSHARNRGIQEAKNDLLIFVDDDVEFEPSWLKEITRLFDDPKTGMVGGRMLPFNVDLPSWLPAKYYYLIGVVDLGEEVREAPFISGGNIAIRKKVVDNIGNFNVDLGRTGNKLLGGEEVEISLRTKLSGYKIIYNPAAIVLHKISNKINTDYIEKFAYLGGTSEAYMDKRFNRGKFVIKVMYSNLHTLIKGVPGTQADLDGRKIRALYLKGYAASLYK
jgi:GT2 family glycosyltransferase